MFELSLQTSFTTFCSRGARYVFSLAATLLVENTNSTSLLKVQDNNGISGCAFKNLNYESKAGKQKWVVPQIKEYYVQELLRL